MDFVFSKAGVSIPVRGVDEPNAVLSNNFETQRAHIEEALERVPPAHLTAIPPIVVGDRPSRGGGFYRNPPTIGLNRRTFLESHNARYLFTLLHEIGHAVDERFHIVSRFIRETGRQGTNWDTYRAIVYRGRNRIRSGAEAGTPQYGEHFAEGYAHILTRPWALTPPQQTLIRRLAGL